jgi:glyoxylase-like metal-dependent hydrolase (beta-lactamase superfamily II)
MSSMTRVGPGIYYMDARTVGRIGVSGIYFLVGDGITLIETATSLIAPMILEGVREIGFKESDIKRAIVTHIHLDHAGATGWLVRRLPHLQVYVHEKGLKHLKDPAKLIDSAKMVYGDMETILAIHGEILPVPGKNLIPVANAALDIGGNLSLQLLDTPGHAPHHLCIFAPESGHLFTGEALGHNYPEIDLIQPAVAPPGFDYEASKATIRRLGALKPKTICFSQYGQRRDPAFIVETAERQLNEYYDLVLNQLKKGRTSARIIEVIKDSLFAGRPDSHMQYQGMLGSIVSGYEVYFKRAGMIG